MNKPMNIPEDRPLPIENPVTRASGTPGQGPDPGSSSMARICWIVAVVLLGLTIVLQQMRVSAHAPTAHKEIEPPGFDSVMLVGKMAVKFHAIAPSPSSAQFVQMLEDQARRDEDKVRAVTVAGDILGGQQAIDRLNALDKKLAPDSALRTDVETLRTIYDDPRGPGAVSAEQASALKARHGYFGELALTFGQKNDDPQREKLVGGGAGLLAFFMLVALIVVGAIVAGFVFLGVGVYKVLNRTMVFRMDRPEPGGSMGVEMLVVFIAGFVLLRLVTELIANVSGGGQVAALTAAVVLQWALALVIFYPKFRFGNLRDGWQRLGLHRGRGVLREIGCGFVGYLACLPLYLLGLGATMILMVLKEIVKTAINPGAGPAEPPSNPLFDLFSGSSMWLIVALGLLATVWAPLVEETVFRGATFRQVLARWGFFGAAMVSSVMFALMHGYGLELMPPLICLALGFAFIRLWRGSLIACMTAHCIHNSFVTLMLFTMIQLLK
jgi:membrane protease YdiL (CAAX protease family)